MAKSLFSQPHFHNEAAAFAYVEARLWPNGPVCPLSNKKTGVICASLPQRVGKLEGVRTKPSKKNPQGVVRHGLHKCYHCRGQFTVPPSVLLALPPGQYRVSLGRSRLSATRQRTPEWISHM